MKLSTIVSTSILALSAAALIAGGASAAVKLNSSKSNIYKLDAGNPDAEKQCAEKGGSVKDGMCVVPSSGGTPQSVAATTVKGSKSNSDNRTGATPQPAEATTINTSKSNTFKTGTAPGTTEADCTKQGGKVETGKDGAKWCTIASSKNICIIYKPGHEGDDRYCSQSVPEPK